MNILVIGGGGREHAIIRKLKEDPRAETIYALPGNGGIAAGAVCGGVGACDIPGMVDFAKAHAVDFVVVAPDDPLVLGAVDAFTAAGFPCFGPRKDAAAIEGSKVFAKELMKKYHIPTAAYEVFSDLAAALDYVEHCPLPTVVKADGLALGKGVLICETREAAREAVRSMMEGRIFGESGARVVIEEFLTGPEVSVLSFTDGETVVPMVSSMDHKRALDGDQGLNTGGMGTVAPNPYYTPENAAACMEAIFLPTIQAMRAEGRPFQGCLYFGLMLTADGPKVIEYNCRFGDPETQVVLPLLEGSLLEIMLAVSEGRLTQRCASAGNPPAVSSWPPRATPRRMRRASPSPCRRPGQMSISTSPGRRRRTASLSPAAGACWARQRWRTPCPPRLRGPTPWPAASTSTTPTAAGTSGSGLCRR